MKKILLNLSLLMLTLVTVAATEAVPVFQVDTFETAHPYGSVLILQNNVGHKAQEFRVLLMRKIDPEGECIPGNVVEQVLSFAGDSFPVALPLAHFRFTLAVYRGVFVEEAIIHDRDLLLAKNSVFEYHGDEVYQLCEQTLQEKTSIQQIRLMVKFDSNPQLDIL